MHLAVSLLSLRPGRVGGAETYLRELCRHLGAVAGDDRLTAVLHPEAADAVETPGMDRLILPVGDARLVAARLLDAATPLRARAAERAFAALAADAVLFPQQSIFPRRAPVRAVLTVHDLLHLAHPDILSLADRAFRAAIYARSLRRAARIIAISEFTKRELITRCGVDAGRISVVRQGVRPPSASRAAPWRGASGPYLYYPAASWPHKDHETLFRSYAALRRSGRLEARLVLTGERTAHWPRLARLARSLGISGDVLHLGFVPAGEVEGIYAGAAAVVFPSRHEGFGMPVAEAARLGVPFVTSRLPAFEELGVPAARQIDFADPDALLRALQAGGPAVLARPPGLWADVARCTLAVMREAACPLPSSPSTSRSASAPADRAGSGSGPSPTSCGGR